jgi:DNA-binding NarL/FixJ family response regulator
VKTNPLRILVVDDHFMVALGLISALNRERDMKVVGDARDGRTALGLFETLRPDVTLMDGMLPDMHGVEVTRRIIATHPDARVILVSINETADDIQRAMDAGARAYLPKSSEKSEMVKAIRAVGSGETFLPERLAERLSSHQTESPLSGREIDVLRLVAQGRANKEIAAELGLSEPTVKTYLVRVFGKLGAPDRTSAVTLAIERGYLRL